MAPANKNKCPHCNKQVGDKENALECEICQKWHHIKCENISQKTYEFPTNSGCK